MKELVSITLTKQELDVLFNGLDLAVKASGLNGANYIAVAQNISAQIVNSENSKKIVADAMPKIEETKQEESNGNTQS